MNLQTTFMLEETEATAVARIKDYLEHAGYSPYTEVPLQYCRGSFLGSFARNNPLKWRAIAKIDVITEGAFLVVDIHVNVDTTWQMVTNHDRKFWKSELVGIELAATTGLIDVNETFEAARLAVSSAWKGFLLWMGAGFALAIPTGLLAVVITGNLYMVNVGVIGIGAGFLLACWKYWGKPN